MAIDTGIASNIRKPGRYQKFNVANAARGGTPRNRAIALVGVQSSAATATAETPVQIFSEQDADNLFGVGSELALMARWALRGARDYGKTPEIFGVPIAAPSGAARVQNFTIASGTATEAAEMVVKIAGRVIRAAISVGDDQDAAALALVDSINEQAINLPLTAAIDGSNANEVEMTFVHDGENAADVEFEIIEEVAGLGTTTTAQETAGSGTADITNAVDALLDRDYDFVAIANHAAADIADLAAHMTDAWAAGTKRWRHSIVAERGTLLTAQSLATAADDYDQIVISAEGFRNTCGELAAYVGAMLAGEDDVKLPWNDIALPSLYLPEATDVPLDAELETGIAGGLFMLSVNAKGIEAKIVRACTTKVTHSSQPYYELLDLSVSALMVKTARRIDSALALAFPRATIDAATQKRVRSVCLSVLKIMETQGDLKDVDDYVDELQVEVDGVVSTRYNVAVPSSPVRPLNQIANLINLLA